MTEPVTPSASADWYPDPQGSGRLRYWDGTSWTPHYAPASTPPTAGPTPVAPRPASGSRTTLWVVLGVVGLLAVIGVVVTVVVLLAAASSSRYSGRELANDVVRTISANGSSASGVTCPDVSSVGTGTIVSCTGTVDGEFIGIRVTFDDAQGHFTLTREVPS